MKGKINFIIDVIMFVLMALLAGIGLLIKYILLSGENRWIKYGRNVDLSFWGLDRHEWGTIHLWIAIALIVLLVLHIILHWSMIICLYKRIIGNKASRIICGSALSVLTLLFVVFPFIIKVDMAEISSGKERFGSEHQTEINEVTKQEPVIIEASVDQESIEEYVRAEHHHIDESIVVKGYNTLKEISGLYGVPCDYLKEKLNIPTTVSDANKLGHLRKQYGFKMSEIELIIYNYLNSGSHEKDN